MTDTSAAPDPATDTAGATAAPHSAPESPRRPLGAQEQYCRSCGSIISTLAYACPKCGAPTGSLGYFPGASPRSRLVALLLCFFIGVFGAHRFYVGKIGTGLLQLFTIGGLGIWAFIDFIMIIVGAFTDKEGRPVLNWEG